jgi:hypothetical protein
MKTQVAVPVQTERFLEVAEFLRSKGDKRDPVQAISDAIDYWLDNASWKPELLSQSQARGYQWKSLFLPDGTEVRMQYKGAYSYAKVEGDQLTYDGKPTTPGSLANTIAGSSRNAWRDLWVKRPADREWRLADDCRADGTSDQTS